jgi:malate dehydrogenase (oxaloacetate-decarboxylating)
MNNDIYKKSLDLHKEHGGKLESKSKVRLDSKEILSLAYSPGVAEVSRVIALDPSLAKIYTLKKNTIAIVSDGSAILGLGNLGPLAAIPVMEGKACIFKEFADVDAFPICLQTQDTEEIINIVKNIAPVFGGINLEDISAPRCFEIEERLRCELDIPVMHDDQWGAATVTLAALINSLKLLDPDFKNKKEIYKIVFSGVGAAGVATARLLNVYGFKNIIYCDSQGIIHKDRTDLNKEKIELIENSKALPKEGKLEDAILEAQVFIGLSKPNTMTKDMLKSMTTNPIIFALANPTPEIMPEDALEAGAFVVATGRSDYPNQINNSLVFPGAFKGMLENNIPQFKIEMFSAIAEALAESLNDVSPTKIIHSMFDKEVVDIVRNTIKGFK